MITLRYRFVLRAFHRCYHRCNGLQCVTRTYFATSINVNKLRIRRLLTLSSFVLFHSSSSTVFILQSTAFSLPPFLPSYRMPKEGLSAAEWRRRLRGFAQGDRLGRGQRPRRNSYWARTLEGIEKCPRHRSAATHDPFGRPLACKCGFHKPTPALDPPRRTHAPVLVTFSN